MKRLLTSAAVIVILSLPSFAGTWTILDSPGSSFTYLRGIDGDNIVGLSSDGKNLYNTVTQTWSTLNIPGGAYNISGSNITGYYGTGNGDYWKGFLYNGASWTTIHNSEADITYAYGIDGSNIVGRYRVASTQAWKGFLYNDGTWTQIKTPDGFSCTPFGIDGTKIVGQFSNYRGFLLDGTNWTALDMPGATRTYIRDISGSNLAGYYYDSADVKHGFLFNGTNWFTLDAPGAIETYAYGIDGDKIVGYYLDSSFRTHGFIYEIPEPCTLLFFGLGALAIRRK